MKVKVVEANITQQPIETTQRPDWGIDENGEMWTTPGDKWRKFLPGPKYITLTLENGAVISWDEWPPPEYVEQP